ncbi:RAVE complex subunit Rav1 [Sesbania bispinosa]|nr:RAVE complex subunit Rav1 [Sesbania bispinosa]
MANITLKQLILSKATTDDEEIQVNFDLTQNVSGEDRSIQTSVPERSENVNSTRTKAEPEVQRKRKKTLGKGPCKKKKGD